MSYQEEKKQTENAINSVETQEVKDELNESLRLVTNSATQGISDGHTEALTDLRGLANDFNNNQIEADALSRQLSALNPYFRTPSSYTSMRPRPT